MIKRAFLALALFAGLLSPAYSAGTISLSLTQRLDNITAKPLNGGKLYFIQAGTTSTPQSAYQDSALTIPWPNPITLDAGGNIPQLFFADGSIKIRLTNAAGVNQIVADNIQVVGNSSGGGGGSPVDATTVLATGDVKTRYGTGILTGFVRANGRTIGSATSGATERANADAQALFEYLWQTDANLTVSTGRGASANADWVANKTITLPDMRGRAIAGMDDMGNTSAGRLDFSSTTLGAVGGNKSVALSSFHMAPFLPIFTGTAGAVSVTSTVSGIPFNGAAVVAAGGGGFNGIQLGNIGPISSEGNFTPAGSISGNGGSSTPFSIINPMMVMTTYMKL